MYINHTPDNCAPLGSKKKFLKSSSGLLVQNNNRDKSMKREQAPEKKTRTIGLYILPCTILIDPTIVSGSIFYCRFHLIHVKRER